LIVLDSDIRSGNKPVQNPAVLSRPAFDDNFLLVNSDTGASLVLNGCGKMIWNLIDGKRTEAEIIAQVCKNFQNVPDTVTDDIITMISTLSEEGFIRYKRNTDSLKK
jgi:hypothetical protein